MNRKHRQSKSIKYNLTELEKDAAVIRRDFSVFCDYVSDNKVKIAKKTGNIGKLDCFALNALFHVKEEYEKPAYLQNQYPIVNFFYYVAVKYKILEINSAGTLLQKGRNYPVFQESSAWEQYALFLVVFLYDGMFAGRESTWYVGDVTDRWLMYVDGFMEWVDREKPRAGSPYQMSGNNRISYFRCLDFITPYMQELNLIKVWNRPTGESWGEEDCWRIETLPLLEMVSDLYENADIDENMDENEIMDEQRTADIDAMMPYIYETYIGRIVREEKMSGLLRLFENASEEDWEQTVDLEFSVRYTDCIRVIRMNLSDSLYDLHRIIQEAVAFDDDHLFEFSVGSGMLKRTYTLPECMNSVRDLSVDKTRLRDLELCKGQKFTYLFDFGDMWWFDIKVLEIQKGTVEAPEVIKAVNGAPDQYPVYEEDMEEWKAEISDQIQISGILAAIDDELIRGEYAALTGVKDDFRKESPDKMRQNMERILLENPDRMLTFMTAEMRKLLLRLLQEECIEDSERCTLAKLYSFGFCKWSEEDEAVILVPKSVKEVYFSKIKAAGRQDRIVETAEIFLRRCGVMEMQRLHLAVAKFTKSKIAYEDFDFLVYSRLHYFGEYYCDRYNETEYMSCYDREMTQKILAERQKPENAVFDYPDFGELYSKKVKESPKAMEKWTEYINFNLNIDWQTAGNLIVQIPAMAATGVIGKEEITAVYKEMIHGAGGRVTKKAEGLIDALCATMPLVSKKGNTGSEDHDSEKGDPGETAKPTKTKGASKGTAKPAKTKGASNGTAKRKKTEGDSDGMKTSENAKGGKKIIQEEYTQLSIFDL